MVIARHANSLKQCLTTPRQHVLCVFHPTFEPYAQALKPHRLVYYLFDDFARELDSDLALRDAHNRLVERADLVVATTAGIARSMLGSASGRASILPNGADSELIASLADRLSPPFCGDPDAENYLHRVVN
jgi:hypothetical protein